MKLSQSLSFRLDSTGKIRIRSSDISPEFFITPDIFWILKAIQMNIPFPKIPQYIKETLKNTHVPNDYSQDIEALISEGIILNESSYNTQENLLSDSWIQWSMISDDIRTKTYLEALQKIITPECTVMDLGSGTGIFALSSLHFGAKKALAIEESYWSEKIPLLAKRLGLPVDRLEVFSGNSMNIKDMRSPDILVHEIFGNDPLEEGLIPYLMDIQKKIKPHHILPQKISVYGQACEIHPESSLFYKIEAFQKYSQQKVTEKTPFYDLFLKEFIDINHWNDLSFTYKITAQDFIPRSESLHLWSLSFKDLSSFKTKDRTPKKNIASNNCHNLDFIKNTQNSEKIVTKPYVFLLWFRMHVDNDLTLSNHPLQDDYCHHWSLIVVPFKNYPNLNQPLEVKSGVSQDLLSLTVQLKQNNAIIANRGDR